MNTGSMLLDRNFSDGGWSNILIWQMTVLVLVLCEHRAGMRCEGSQRGKAF